MPRNVIREECDTVDEVCALFNQVFARLDEVELKLASMAPEVKQPPAVKKKGGRR